MPTRGLAEAEETCDIAGVGPVSVATVEELLGDPFGAAIVTNGVDVFTVAHLGRSVTAHPVSYTHLTLPTTERV